jgi:hypothetical protein
MSSGRLAAILLWTGFGFCWLGAAGFGLVSLMSYDNRPGVAAEAPSTWPAESRIARDAGRATLVMLAHPRCDCTNASLGELAELMARVTTRPRAYVVFIKPGGVANEWEKTSLWRAAERIPDVTVIRDDNGQEAGRFGTVTSGQMLLYDVHGHLVFSGGTTGGRGKSGDNAGRATLLALLNGERPTRRTTPVFGCALVGPADEPVNAHTPKVHDHES